MVTLKIYAHLFDRDDRGAADAIDRMLGGVRFEPAGSIPVAFRPGGSRYPAVSLGFRLPRNQPEQPVP